MIFDTHAHYDDEAFEEDREELLGKMQEAGIGGIVNVGASLRGLRDSVALAKGYSFVYGAVGIHPDHIDELTDAVLDEMREAAREEKIVAIGEIGLDYYWDKHSREQQKEAFCRQLEVAKETDLPVIIHSREAAQDTFDLMKECHSGTTGGVIHCYSGSKEMARDYLNMGYYLGIGGVITFKNARVLKEVVAYAPLDRIVTETDCPYLAPTPYRGKRNSSIMIPYILDEIAQIKGITREEAEQATWENAQRMYRIQKK